MCTVLLGVGVPKSVYENKDFGVCSSSESVEAEGSVSLTITSL